MTPKRDGVNGEGFGFRACKASSLAIVFGLSLLLVLPHARRWCRRRGENKYHETQIPPLIQKIAIDINAIRLTQIFRDQGPDCGEILLLQCMLVLNVAELGRELGGLLLCDCIIDNGCGFCQGRHF